VLSKLESDEEHAKLEKNKDVVGLLKKLKTMAFLTGGVQDPFWALQNALKRLVGVNQGKEESVDNYKKRFIAMTQVLEQQWGKFCPTELAEDETEAAQKVATEKFFSRVFLAGADKDRYESLINKCNNDYISKKDEHPATVEKVATLLSNYQVHERKDGAAHARVDNEQDGARETSFVTQSRRRRGTNTSRRCWNCDELGHLAVDCPQPRRGNSNMQADDVSSEDYNENRTAGSGGRCRNSNDAGWSG